jgi:hypothetical protein
MKGGRGAAIKGFTVRLLRRSFASMANSLWRVSMELEALLQLIRQKLADGRLPHNSIPRVWGGQGNNEVCGACDRIIEKNQFVMEGIGAAMKAVQFHVRCFYYWDAERKPPGR